MVTLAEIQQEILASRGGSHGSWPWTRKMLARADEQFGGPWREVALTADQALEILLPPHSGEPCRGDLLTVVGSGGATVREAARTLTSYGEAYAKNNPSCAERIGFASEAAFSHVVLCTAPLDWEEYAKVTPVDGARYCIDGFHRLVAWAAAGRISGDVTLSAWIAGA